MAEEKSSHIPLSHICAKQWLGQYNITELVVVVVVLVVVVVVVVIYYLFPAHPQPLWAARCILRRASWPLEMVFCL